jgi:hypothetical protein
VNWLTYIQLGFNIALVGITPLESMPADSSLRP